jgi:hypothetical protein
VYVAGTAPRAGGVFGADVVLVRFDATGAVVLQRAYSGSEIADARGGVALAPDESVYVAGAIQATTPSVVVDALLVKFGADGTLVWDRSWGGRSRRLRRGGAQDRARATTGVPIPSNTVLLGYERRSWAV